MWKQVEVAVAIVVDVRTELVVARSPMEDSVTSVTAILSAVAPSLRTRRRDRWS